MKRLLGIVVMVLLVVVSVSCDNDDNNGLNVKFGALEIVDAQLPESFELGNTYEVQVTFLRPDNCTYFQGFDVYPTATTVREVVAVGARYADQPCAQEAIEVTDSFLFKVIHNETYTFRFYTGEDAEGNPEFIETEVPVN